MPAWFLTRRHCNIYSNMYTKLQLIIYQIDSRYSRGGKPLTGVLSLISGDGLTRGTLTLFNASFANFGVWTLALRSGDDCYRVPIGNLTTYNFELSRELGKNVTALLVVVTDIARPVAFGNSGKDRSYDATLLRLFDQRTQSEENKQTDSRSGDLQIFDEQKLKGQGGKEQFNDSQNGSSEQIKNTQSNDSLDELKIVAKSQTSQTLSKTFKTQNAEVVKEPNEPAVKKNVEPLAKPDGVSVESQTKNDAMTVESQTKGDAVTIEQSTNPDATKADASTPIPTNLQESAKKNLSKNSPKSSLPTQSIFANMLNSALLPKQESVKSSSDDPEFKQPSDEVSEYEKFVVATDNYYATDMSGESVKRYGTAFEKFVKQGSGSYYQTVADELATILEKYPPNESFISLFPNSVWVTIGNNGKHFVLGVITEQESPLYICYGLPCENRCSTERAYVLTDSGGYNLIFQNASTGKIQSDVNVKDLVVRK